MAKDYTEQRRIDNMVYAVKAELANHGIIANFVCNADGTCKTELTVTNVNGKNVKKRVKIKKNTQGDYRWFDEINSVNKFGVDNNHIYVLVDEFDQLHIVPSRAYKNSIEAGHYEWLISYGKNGKKHNDNPKRNFYDFNNDFLNAFEFFSI